MRLPDTLPTTALRHWQEHEIVVPPLCPKSKNPRPGSTIVVGYWTGEKVIEVNDFFAFLHFKGGLKDDEGTIIIRAMEEMVSAVYEQCREALGTPVAVFASWEVVARQTVRMIFDPDEIWPSFSLCALYQRRGGR